VCVFMSRGAGCSSIFKSICKCVKYCTRRQEVQRKSAEMKNSERTDLSLNCEIVTDLITFSTTEIVHLRVCHQTECSK
jgi:hypothetical protein